MESDSKTDSSADDFLDRMLGTEEAARWLGMKERALLQCSAGRRPRIPGFWFNRRVVRFHPRTIIAKLAAESGVSAEVIVAMLGKRISSKGRGVEPARASAAVPQKGGSAANPGHKVLAVQP